MKAVFGAIKEAYGNDNRCHKSENRGREIAIRIIDHGIKLLTRSQIKDGKLASKLIASMTAYPARQPSRHTQRSLRATS